MSNKTKAIIAVIIIALTILGYFFIGTTATIEMTFNKIGRIAILVLVVALAIAVIVLINKAKKAKDEHDAKKAKRAEIKARKENESADNKQADGK